MKTLAVCIANNYSAFDKYFVNSLLEMQLYFNVWGHPKGYEISILIQGGYAVDAMRNDLVETALEFKQDYLVFLDTDMAFPRETLVKLLLDIEKNKKYGIEAVTGLYVMKNSPYKPHVYFKYNEKTKKFWGAGYFPLNKLFPVEGAGCGCLAVKREVFERIKPPYFKFKNGKMNDKVKEKMYKRKGYIPEKVGEDLYFFLKANPKTLCDPTIQCLHYQQKGVDIMDYINFFGLEGDRKGFKVTDEQLTKIKNYFDKK